MDSPICPNKSRGLGFGAQNLTLPQVLLPDLLDGPLNELTFFLVRPSSGTAVCDSLPLPAQKAALQRVEQPRIWRSPAVLKAEGLSVTTKV
jgi:hypothetical protein